MKWKWYADTPLHTIPSETHNQLFNSNETLSEYVLQLSISYFLFRGTFLGC